MLCVGSRGHTLQDLLVIWGSKGRSDCIYGQVGQMLATSSGCDSHESRAKWFRMFQESQTLTMISSRQFYSILLLCTPTQTQSLNDTVIGTIHLFILSGCLMTSSQTWVIPKNDSQ